MEVGGEPGRSDYESAEASLGRRRPQPTPRCQPRRLRGTDGRTDGRGGPLPCAEGTGPCGEGEGAAPPRGAPANGGSLRAAAPGRGGRGFSDFFRAAPERRGGAVGPGRAGGPVPPEPLVSDGGGRARGPRRDSLRICVEISSLPFFLLPGARLHLFL